MMFRRNKEEFGPLPTLDVGSHSPTSGKACVMEYVSVLAGEDWSDNPSCTTDLVASVARMINDNGYMDHACRIRLVEQIPRLLVANGPGLDQALERWLAHQVGVVFAPNLMGKNNLALAMLSKSASLPSTQLELLIAMLDEVDRVLGRTTNPKLTVAQIQAADQFAMKVRVGAAAYHR